MFEVFEKYLKEKQPDLTEEDLGHIRAVSVFKKLRKRQYLLQEGDISHHTCFIIKGCLRNYRLSEDGVEHILKFAVETWWMSDLESYNNNLPSKNNIDAVEDCELLLIEKKDFEKLIENMPTFRQFHDKLKSKSVDTFQNRIISNISDTAEEKYFKFIKTYPDIFNRVPLHMIASYLGVSRETLSRIRINNARSH
jgi:CRP-like cAMP-binding protein